MYLDLYRRMTPAERLHRAFSHSAFVRELAMGALRVDHPAATEREIFLLEARRRLGANLFRKVYGGDEIRNG